MYCPNCSVPLRAVERQGISLDYCRQCQGIWLDAGELDQLVQREALIALRAGQSLLREARRDREYDRVDFDAPPPALPLEQLPVYAEVAP